MGDEHYDEEIIDKIIEELAPNLIAEEPAFLLPDNDLAVETIQRHNLVALPEHVFASGPLFLSTCYDEFSRKYIVTSTAKESSDVLELDKSTPDIAEDESSLVTQPQSILKFYSPNLQRWYSTYRKVPRDLRPILSGEVAADSNILIRINLSEIKVKPCFEPVFVSACLFAFVGDELHRLSESFSFDLTPPDIRKQFPFVYNSTSKTGEEERQLDEKVFMYMAMLPEELKSLPVYLVMQLNKVLSTDAEKAVAPYFPKAQIPEVKKHLVSTERLTRYRQPVGIGVVKLERDKMRIGAQINVTIPTFCLRTCCSDTGISQIIKELFPGPEAVAKSILYSDSNKFRPEELDLKLKLSFFNLGTTDQSMDRIREVSIVSGTSTEKRTTKLLPTFIEPQVFGDTSAAKRASTSRHRVQGNQEISLVKKLLPLIPPTLPGSQEVVRQLRNAFDNTMFVYVSQFDKMPSSARNLSAKIELVEIKGTIYERRMPLPSATQITLENIYDPLSPFGHEFVNESFSRVSYHVRNPSICDEVKIKLPEVLTARHWLKFTVLHVHVKPQTNRGSLLSNIIRSSIDKDMLSECDVVGVGYLPLLVNGENLLEDSEHMIGLFSLEHTKHPDFSVSNGMFIGIPSKDGSDCPVLRVRTRAFSSFTSGSRQIQSLFRASPLPLGILSSSSLAPSQQVRIFQRASKLSLQEAKLISCLQELHNASVVELSRHFLVVTRLLVRAMLGGTGSYDENYANPFKHANGRCSAFLTFMRVLSKVFGEYNITNSSETNVNKDVFDAFIEYVLDEEVPIDAATMELIEEELANAAAAQEKEQLAAAAAAATTTTGKVSASAAIDEIALLSPRFESTPKSNHISEKFASMVTSDSPSTLPAAHLSTTNVSVAAPAAAGVMRVTSEDNDDAYSVSDDGGEHSSEASRPASNPPSIIQIPHLRESSENLMSAAEVLSADDINVGINFVSDDLKGSVDDTDSRAKMVYIEYSQTVDENEVEMLQPLSTTSKTSVSLERKSWGKYLSDSMWQSGRFLPIYGFENDTISRAAGSDAVLNGMPSKEETTEKYLDDIALHITQQIERIISEHLISLAVIETSSSIDVDISDMPMFDDDTESNALLSGKIDVDALLAGKRYRYSYQQDSKRRDLPFHAEHGWFESIDNGSIIDDEEVLLNEDVARQRLTTKLSRRQAPTRNHLTIASSNQFFDILDGFKDRKEAVLRGPEFSSFVTHWWPWLYEVIIYQWVAALSLILSAAGKVNSNTIESMIVAYPFDLKADKDLRAIMLEKSSVLLRVILKSLTFRIKFQGMTSPVLMDEQCFSALENLVMMMALQSFDLMAGLWLARDTVRMVSSFLRSLFAILAPGQVIKLIQSFFKVGKMKSKTEELELRLLAAEELSYFDHFVAANFPLALDAPSSLFLNVVLDNWNASEMNSLTAYTASGIRYSSCPGPYTFVQLLLSELVVATHPDCPRRELAWRILRDLIARHASDSRYQSAESQQRIACMYLPLFGEILASAEYLSSLRYDAVERKEALSIFLYLVNALPERLLRQKLRDLCLLPQRSAFSRSNSLFSPTNVVDVSSPESSMGGKTPRVISLKAAKAHGKLSDIDGFISQSEKRANSLYAMCTLFHMVLDTFEVPSSELCRDGAFSTLSDKATENLGQVLAPTCSIGTSNISTAAAGGNSNGSTSNGALSSAAASEVTVRNSILSENVPTTRASIDPKDALDAHMQSKKSAISSAKSTLSTVSQPSSNSTASLSTNTDLGSVAGGGGGSGGSSTAITPTAASANSSGQRRWAEKKQKIPGASAAGGSGGGDATAGRDKTIAWAMLSREDAAIAVKNLSITSVRTVLRCLWLMYDECPSALDQIVKSGEQCDTFVTRDTNLDESMLNGVANFKIVPFLRMALTVLLHALYANQDRSDLADIFLCADTAIRRFGARLFILALEDSLQYWMHVCMFHAASPFPEVRQHVCNFLLCFLRSSYYYFGTFNLISNTILAIFNDVQYDILENHRHEITAPSDVDKLLSRLGESIQQMRQAARDKIARGEAHPKRKRYPFCSSLIAFMNSLETILLASADLRRYVNHPVLYDYYGGNMLDGPFDERVGILMQSIRNRRKAVKAEGGMDQQQGGVRSGFHIEEIMTHFLQAAEVYDPMILPRFRMQWLENLARLHDLRQNRAEGAEVRWLIFKLCQQVEATWQQLWVPKPPLEWLRRGMNPVETGLGHLSAIMMSTMSAGGGGSAAAGASGTGGSNSNTTGAPAGSGVSNASTPHSASSSSASADRNFYQVLTRALDAQMFRPWVDASQYWQHMEMALSIATDRYCTANLVHLAERSSSHLISLYRLTKKTEKMMAEYLRIANTIKAVQDKGITTEIAMGTFYRVLYTGEGIPLHLRDKEFIFRNATHLHVSEFHALVMNHVKSIVADGVEIKMVKDATSSFDASPTSGAAPVVTGANIVMNSVKLCMAQQSKHNPDKLLDGKRHLNRMNHTEDLHQVTMFQYSVPFTLENGRSHAKKIDDQWMRTTTLHVREPFPYALTRQLVVKRDVKILSPIEVATQDIQDRVESMEMEIDSGVKTTNDTNNLMRLVQGTVRPQVNAGAGEVAKVFLSSHKVLSEETQWQMKWAELQEKYPPSLATSGEENQARRLGIQTLLEEKRRGEELVTTLKMTLLTFLQCARQLLWKSRRILLGDNSSLEVSPYLLIDHAGSGSGGSLGTQAAIVGASSNAMGSYSAPMAGLGVVGGMTGSSGGSGGSRVSVGSTTSAMNSVSSGITGSSSQQRRSVNDLPAINSASANAFAAGGNTAMMLGNAGHNSGTTNPVIANAAVATGAGGAGGMAGSDANYILWQAEMEKGYETLVNSIFPYISELREAASLAPKPRG